MASSPIVPPPPPGSVRVRSAAPPPPPGSVRVDPPQPEQKFSRPEDVPPVATTLGFLGNIPKSGAKLVTDIAGAVLSPIETAKGLASIVQDPAKMKDFFVERYGSLDNALWTLYNDPAGFAGDVSAITGIAGIGLRAPAAGLRAAGATTAAGKVAATGKSLTNLSRTIDPLAATARGIKGTGLPRAIGDFTKAGFGASTGVGKRAVEIALNNNTKPFRDAMRGKINSIDIINDARSAISRVRAARGVAYRQQLAQLKTSSQQLNIAPIRQRLNNLLGEFRVTRTVNAKGVPQLDFSRAAVGKKAHAQIAEVVDVVDNWNDFSVLGVDALKRRVADVFGETSQARAFVSGVGNEIRGTLDQVPGYREMTREYAKATELIKMIDQELSLGQQSGTVMRKLSNALNQNSDFREIVIEALDNAVSGELTQKIAGASMSSLAPRGIMRPLAAGHILWAVAGGQVEAIPAVLLASPQAVGETLTAISALKRGAASVGRQLPSVPGAVVYRPLAVAPGDTKENE